MFKLKIYPLFAAMLLLTGCINPQPTRALKDVKLAEGPVLIQRGPHFYLRYRHSLDVEPVQLATPAYVYGKKTKEAGYLFFMGGASGVTWGNTIEYPLAAEG